MLCFALLRCDACQLLPFPAGSNNPHRDQEYRTNLENCGTCREQSQDIRLGLGYEDILIVSISGNDDMIDVI